MSEDKRHSCSFNAFDWDHSTSNQDFEYISPWQRRSRSEASHHQHPWQSILHRDSSPGRAHVADDRVVSLAVAWWDISKRQSDFGNSRGSTPVHWESSSTILTDILESLYHIRWEFDMSRKNENECVDQLCHRPKPSDRVDGVTKRLLSPPRGDRWMNATAVRVDFSTTERDDYRFLHSLEQLCQVTISGHTPLACDHGRRAPLIVDESRAQWSIDHVNPSKESNHSMPEYRLGWCVCTWIVGASELSHHRYAHDHDEYLDDDRWEWFSAPREWTTLTNSQDIRPISPGHGSDRIWSDDVRWITASLR